MRKHPVIETCIPRQPIRASSLISTVFMLALLSFSAPAAAEPVLAVGSIYQINEVATVQGTGFAAYETVQIRLVDPNGERSDQTATADENGNVAVTVVLSDEGKYFAILLDSKNEGVLSVSMTAM